MKTNNTLQDVIRHSLKVFKTQKPLKPLEHANTKFFLSPDVTNSNGFFKAHPYQRFFINTCANLNIQKVAIQKPAQIGYTQILKWLCGFECSHRHRSTAIYFPTQTDSNEFASTQIASLLRDCPDVAEQLVVDHDKRHADNQNARRKFKQAILYCRGATSANNFRRISFSTGLIDELDAVPSNIDGEGSSDSLIWSRMFAHRYRKLVMGSTPTIKNQSNIETVIQSITEHFYRFFPCPHCEEYQQLVWGGSDAKHGIVWDKILNDDDSQNFEKSAETARYCCKHCEKEFDYKHLRNIDKKALWKSQNYVADDVTTDFYDHDGNKVKAPKECAILCNGLLSYTVTWSDAVYQYLRAVEKARDGDNGSLVTFVNEYLGEVYTPTEIRDSTPYSVLYNRRKSYGAEIPEGCIAITYGVDVQEDRLEISIIGWGMHEIAYVIDHKVIQCDPASESEIWTHLFDLVMNKTYYKPSGESLSCALCCIDSGYLTDTVYKFCRQATGKLIPVKGLNQYGRPVADMPPAKTKHGVYNTLIGTDTAKDILYSRYRLEFEQAGYIYFPEHLTEDYFKQLVSEYKKVDFKSGQPVERWYCPNSRRNECLDCFVYCLAAIRILQSRYNVSLTQVKSNSVYNPARVAQKWKQRLSL